MTALNFKKLSKGFTLIELLVVIGILAILLAITLIAINPARQFQQSNDTKRRSDVNAILNAIGQYAADNKGNLPGGTVITSSSQVISTASSAGFTQFCTDLVTTYIAALPTDPTSAAGGTAVDKANCGSYNTGYTVLKSASDNRVTVAAPNGQIDTNISATR